ncbi:MAG: microcystin-dependent protein [Flammeovirgaceae bacterium]|jgi:microcystin-dependent protein
MKKSVFLLLVSFLFCFVASAQHKIDEKGFSYQGYARDVGGTALSSRSVIVKFSINVSGSATVVFSEEHSLTTDAFGVFHTIIGTISPTDYKALAFDINNYQMKVEVKTATTNYAIISNAELLAVPYAKAAGNGVPPGTILPFAGENAPIGYLLCDGSSVSSNTYPALSATIGKAWGGSGTNFNLPDLRGQFLRGVDTRTSGNNDPDATTRVASASGGNTGAKVGTTQGEETKLHAHSVVGNTESDGAHEHTNQETGRADNDDNDGVGDYIGGRGSSFNNTQGGTGFITNNGSAHSHAINFTSGSTGNLETRPKNVAVLYIIKY